jgi:hypothetical protein
MKKRDFLRLIRDDVATEVEDSIRGLNWGQILAPHFKAFGGAENASLRAQRAVLVELLEQHNFVVKRNSDGSVSSVEVPTSKGKRR